MGINNLVDLNRLRSAPQLNKRQIKKLLEELEVNILNADWITIGIMACSDFEAISALQSISKRYSSLVVNFTVLLFLFNFFVLDS